MLGPLIICQECRDSAYIVEMAIHLNDQHRYSLADNAAKLRELFLE